jgi:hypothetical protein
MRLTPKAPAPEVAPKHVIAEYRHRTQTVTCVCGWQGSSAGDGIRKSDWSVHVVTGRVDPQR